jgi:nitrite reductase/ring-hydroxylating ferredoxin subunit
MSTFTQPQTIPSFPLAAYPARSPPWEPVAPIAAVAQGISSFAASVIIVRRGDAFHALHALCPHKQGELALGDLTEIEDAAYVICPRHRKKFPGGLHISCASGAASCPKGEPDESGKFDAAWRVPVYATRVEGGWLWLNQEGGGGEEKEKI